MSRCFPYPPPGHARNGVPGEALIESIKIQTGKEKSKSDRSNEKREKKEKREERKRNKQLGLPSKVGDAKISSLGGEKSQCPEKLVKKEKRKRDDQQVPFDEKSRAVKKLKDDPFVVKGKVETEQLEKSGLTEEHEQPVNLQTPCYLSDSTRSSHKRRRQDSPPSTGHTSPSSCSRTHGNVLRIKLPVQKQREPDSLLSRGRDQQCSTSGRVHSASQLNVPKQELSKNLKTVIDIKKVTPKPVEHISKSVPKSTTILKDQVVARVPKPAEQIPRSTTTLRNKVVAQVEQTPRSTTLKNRVVEPHEQIPKPTTTFRNNAVAPVEQLPKLTTTLKNTAKPVEQVPKPTTTVTKSNVVAPVDQLPKPTSTLKNNVVAPVEQIPKPTTTLKTEVVAKPDSEAAPSKTKKPHKDERRWEKLCSKMESFVPLNLQIEQSECDDDWLFGTKPKEQVSKRCRVDDGIVGSANYPLYPHAQFLPEAGIYALPYTVPF